MFIIHLVLFPTGTPAKTDALPQRASALAGKSPALAGSAGKGEDAGADGSRFSNKFCSKSDAFQIRSM